MTRATLRIGERFLKQRKASQRIFRDGGTKRNDASQTKLKNISRERGPKRNLLSMERTRSRQEAGLPAAGWSTAEHRGIQWRMINVVPSFIVSSPQRGSLSFSPPISVLFRAGERAKRNETKRNESGTGSSHGNEEEKENEHRQRSTERRRNGRIA